MRSMISALTSCVTNSASDARLDVFKRERLRVLNRKSRDELAVTVCDRLGVFGRGKLGASFGARRVEPEDLVDGVVEEVTLLASPGRLSSKFELCSLLRKFSRLLTREMNLSSILFLPCAA